MRVTLDSPRFPLFMHGISLLLGASFKLVFLGLEGGPQFISFQGAGVREGYYIFWCQAVVNSSQKIHRVSEKEPKGSGVAELPESRGRVFGRWHLPAWFLSGYCSPWGWSPRQSIWSLRRRVSTRFTVHKSGDEQKTNWLLISMFCFVLLAAIIVKRF